MKVLVTGAAGFIGHHLVRALEIEGMSVHGIDISPMEDLKIDNTRLDITSEEDMRLLGKTVLPDVIVHLAAIASPTIAQKNPKLAWATNVQGTQNVLQLAHQTGCKRVVFFSSAHVYGISPKYMPTDENHPLALHDTYTTTKILGEQICRLYFENHGISYSVLRLWNAYGEGQSPDYFLGMKICQAKKNELTIRNASVTKDWVHVTDVVRATLLAMSSDYVGPLNVGTGLETSLQSIVAAIAKRYSAKVTLGNVPDEGPTRMCCDWRRIKRILGWEPIVGFDEGLARLMEK